MRTKADLETFCEQRAADMRRWPTKAEAVMWPYLQEMGFRRQVSVIIAGKAGHMTALILDFYHAAASVAVEVDGGYHRRRTGPDQRRDRKLKGQGITTLRFGNAEVLDEERRMAVIATIREVLDGEGI